MVKVALQSLLLTLSLTFFFLLNNAQKAKANEPDTSSMEWLTIESLQTPVGNDQTTTPSQTFPEAQPATLPIPSLTQLSFQYPLFVKPKITTFFSAGHPGVDFAVAYGSQIAAAESGTVTEAGWSNQGYGNTIVLHHTKNTYTRYAHLSSISVGVGQYITKGSPIGLVGCTGRCTGSHLHFEIHLDTHFIDPLSVVTY